MVREIEIDNFNFEIEDNEKIIGIVTDSKEEILIHFKPEVLPTTFGLVTNSPSE